MSELSQPPILEQLAFNPQQFRRPCVPGHALFSENIIEVMSGISLGTCLSNMKSITVSKLHWNSNLTIPIFYHRVKWLSLISKERRMMLGISQRHDTNISSQHSAPRMHQVRRHDNAAEVRWGISKWFYNVMRYTLYSFNGWVSG